MKSSFICVISFLLISRNFLCKHNSIALFLFLGNTSEIYIHRKSTLFHDISISRLHLPMDLGSASLTVTNSELIIHILFSCSPRCWLNRKKRNNVFITCREINFDQFYQWNCTRTRAPVQKSPDVFIHSEVSLSNYYHCIRWII